MSFASKTMSLAFTGLLLSASASASFAQAGGSDVPTDAKKQGMKEKGASTTGSTGAMKKEGGAPTKSDKGTATGGNSGQPGKS